MKRALLSALLLMALSGCQSTPNVPQQCAPMEPFPAELEAEPQNLNILLNELISPSSVEQISNTPASSSVGPNSGKGLP